MLWHGEELTPEAGTDGLVYKALPPSPTKAGHWVGYYIELFFPSAQLKLSKYKLTSAGYVWPDTLPFPGCEEFAKCQIKLV